MPVNSFNQYLGKRAQKIRKKIQPIEKRNQSDDALKFFENSYEVQMLNAYRTGTVRI
jgi:hypothetical protein